MTRYFENDRAYWLIINFTLFAFVGLDNAMSNGLNSLTLFGWWFGSLIWFYRFWSFKKYGYLSFTDTNITINYANWQKIRTIELSEIKRIETKGKVYVITIKGLNNFYINKGYISKRLRPELEEIIERIKSNISTPSGYPASDPED